MTMLGDELGVKPKYKVREWTGVESEAQGGGSVNHLQRSNILENVYRQFFERIKAV